MAKFKVGDRVRILSKRNGWSGDSSDESDNCIGKTAYAREYGSSNDVWVWSTPRGNGYYLGIFDEDELELIGGNMGFAVGDILVDHGGHQRKVVAFLNQGVELYGLSQRNWLDSFGGFYTEPELEDLCCGGWKLKTEPETVEKSVAEIEKELGLASGTLRVKKDN